VDKKSERSERASLIEWICVRASHRRLKAVDPSTPLNLHDDGHWSFCPAGLAPEADHLWYATGGVTRAALSRFRWPSEKDATPETKPASPTKTSPRGDAGGPG
jgi:hypothetical protein